ncbi:MAG: M48 family metalloprotease [Clostridia bacterium]|nr:M48 family metalloprotease [Clostridia bacterium]
MGVTGEAQRIIAACVVIIGIVAAALLLELRVPAPIVCALARAEASTRQELSGEALAALGSYIQRCSSMNLFDLPLEQMRRIAYAEQSGVQTDDASRDGRKVAGTGGQSGQSSEAALAKQAHQMILRENGGEWNAELHARRIARILGALAEVSEDSPSAYRVTMLDDSRINAVSTADGCIYITRGLVTTSTDDEIALVVAHEMHHIRSGHWVGWLGLDGRGSRSAHDSQAEASQALYHAGVVAFAGNASTSYQQEFESDASGVLLASLCGFEGQRMYRALTRLPAMPVTSHPTVSDRIAGVRDLLNAMESPAWIYAFHPVEVARTAVWTAMAAAAPNVDVVWTAPGLGAVADACKRLTQVVGDTEFEMRTSGWLGPSWPYGMRGQLVGRVAFFADTLCAVDVAVDTTFGRGTAGTPGVVCGRVWLAKQDGIWKPIVAQALPVNRGIRLTSPEWNSVPDGLRVPRPYADAAPDQGNGMENTQALASDVLAAAKRWRDTAVGRFSDHLATYSRGPLDRTPVVYGRFGLIGDNAVQDSDRAGDDQGGTLEAIGWARFMSGRRGRLRVWNAKCDVYSPTLATVTFSSALSLGGLPMTSNATRLTLVLEDGEWRVAGVSLN